jgi:hypothetical protein
VQAEDNTNDRERKKDEWQRKEKANESEYRHRIQNEEIYNIGFAGNVI